MGIETEQFKSQLQFKLKLLKLSQGKDQNFQDQQLTQSG